MCARCTVQYNHIIDEQYPVTSLLWKFNFVFAKSIAILYLYCGLLDECVWLTLNFLWITIQIEVLNKYNRMVMLNMFVEASVLSLSHNINVLFFIRIFFLLFIRSVAIQFHTYINRVHLHRWVHTVFTVLSCFAILASFRLFIFLFFFFSFFECFAVCDAQN